MFAEKMKQLRNRKGATQQEVANALGITLRTVQNYEMGASLPKKRETIKNIAAYYSVPVSALLSEEDYYIYEAEQRGGEEDARHLYTLLADMSALFAGGRVSEEDRNTVMKTLTDLYWESHPGVSDRHE